MTFEHAQKMAAPTEAPRELADIQLAPLPIKTVYMANGCQTCGADVLQISIHRIRCERDASHTVRFD